MRILLDECLDEDLRHSFRDHDCQTCRYAELKGLANGKLLSAAERAGFNVLVTVDQNLPYQQAGRSEMNLAALKRDAIVSFRSPKKCLAPEFPILPR